MTQGGDASLLEAMEQFRRKNEALAEKCDKLALERNLELLKRDNMRAGLCTPVPERETPVPQSKPNDFEENVTLKKTPLKPLNIVKAATDEGQHVLERYAEARQALVTLSLGMIMGTLCFRFSTNHVK
ncbi:hypothetical protein DPMN_058140 [Dreissena polymorpha]|uniref:Uncharacterized protein n=1 Tax=Dreissena polymorpha TaxID=45954 RepID=A0A9D4HD55_DREPO|nr:hypothetical protein DPMN_058140 [Dreissena polymorpha]